MAKNQITVKTKAGVGKNRGRTCLISDGHAPARLKGGRLGSTKRMHGCFTNLKKLDARKKQLLRD